ncbi:MAG: hypothetical protein SFT94_11885 [Pseudanabaenaceae cyanobacterium bins.68]|nr:hypothetical protein [Pseudanabaenaceae cyanobacterium bins.68]
MIKVLITPQGREYQAVCRGAQGSGVKVIPIPMGNPQLKTQLAQMLTPKDLEQAILIGLCGSMSEGDLAGDWVVYQSCSSQNYFEEPHYINPELTSALLQKLNQKLDDQARRVNGVTLEWVVTSVEKKYQIKEDYAAGYVDMETYEVLSFAYPQSIGVVRVVSDNLQRDLPDLNFALDQGKLNPFKLAIAMISQPINSIFLIGNSLTALKRLEECTKVLVN